MRCTDPGLVEVIEKLHGDDESSLPPACESCELHSAMVGSWTMPQIPGVGERVGHVVKAEDDIARVSPRDMVDACQ
jgi:hypothetical protein